MYAIEACQYSKTQERSLQSALYYCKVDRVSTKIFCYTQYSMYSYYRVRVTKHLLIRSVKPFGRHINAHSNSSLAIGTLTPGAWTVRFGTLKKSAQALRPVSHVTAKATRASIPTLFHALHAAEKSYILYKSSFTKLVVAKKRKNIHTYK